MSTLMHVLTRTLAALGIACAAYLFMLPMGPRRTMCPVYAAEAAPLVDDARFGVEMPIGGGALTALVQTERVPLIPGTTFGWRVHLGEARSFVKLREELILPAAPHLWRHTASTRISQDRRVAVTEELLTPSDGWLGNGWAITEGDPPGEYVLRVYLDDHPIDSFRFLVDAAQ